MHVKKIYKKKKKIVTLQIITIQIPLKFVYSFIIFSESIIY